MPTPYQLGQLTYSRLGHLQWGRRILQLALRSESNGYRKGSAQKMDTWFADTVFTKNLRIVKGTSKLHLHLSYKGQGHQCVRDRKTVVSILLLAGAAWFQKYSTRPAIVGRVASPHTQQPVVSETHKQSTQHINTPARDIFNSGDGKLGSCCRYTCHRKLLAIFIRFFLASRSWASCLYVFSPSNLGQLIFHMNIAFLEEMHFGTLYVLCSAGDRVNPFALERDPKMYENVPIQMYEW